MFARTNRTWWIVGILGCLAMSAVAVWFGIAATAGRVGWQTQSYAVLDDQSVTVTFRVDRPAGTVVRCSLKAMDARFGAVGLADVVVPASQETSTVVEKAPIRTTARAVTGTVDRCVKDGSDTP